MREADEGTITGLNDDVPLRPGAGSHWVTRSLVKLVREHLDRRPLDDEAAVAKAMGIPIRVAARAMQRADEARMRKMREMTDVEKGRQLRRLGGIEREALRPQVLRDKDGKVIKEVVDGAEVPATMPPPAAYLKAAMQAMSEVRDIVGLNAPTRTESFNVTASLVNPDAQRAMVDDPEYGRLVMEMEDRERAFLARSRGDVPGAVRGIGQQGAMVLPAAPLAAEPEDDARGPGDDPSAGDVPAAEDGEVRIPVEVVPGLVSRHLPGSEGDLGGL